MANTVVKAQGTVVKVKDNAATPAFQTVGNVKSINFSGGEASDIDVTSLTSTTKEYELGLRDSYSCELSIMYNPDDAGQVELEEMYADGASREFQVTLANSDVYTFNGLVKSFPKSFAIDGVVETTVSIRLSGGVTIS
mgnify:CR=1 FL=1